MATLSSRFLTFRVAGNLGNETVKTPRDILNLFASAPVAMIDPV